MNDVTSLSFANAQQGSMYEKTVTLLNTGTTKVQIGPVSLSVIAGNLSDFKFVKLLQVSSGRREVLPNLG